MKFSSTTTGHPVLRRIGFAAIALATTFGSVAATCTAANASKNSKPVVRSDALAPIAAQALSDLHDVAAESLWTVGSAVTSSVVSTSANDRYVSARDSIATEVANRLGIEPARMVEAWAGVDIEHQTALMAAMSQLGVRYRRNTSAPGVGFDCSGFTAYAWSVAGVEIAHQSRSQVRNAAVRTIDSARAGDLVYYPGHVMLYLGVDTAIVHAPTSGRTVEVGILGNRRGLRFGDPTG
ncbi:MAG: NlpC/P60 family protein [Actinomycetota bacterium]|jgi:hypothetical protein